MSKTTRLSSGPVRTVARLCRPRSRPLPAPAESVRTLLHLERPLTILLDGEPVDLHALPPDEPLTEARACAEAVHHASNT